MTLPLVPGLVYHIYNRGNNGENLFFEPRNYRYFLELYAKYVAPAAVTYAYCLLPNHFHLLVKIRVPVSGDGVSPSRAFANLFSTYTKTINKNYHRTGSLFEKPFRRKAVTDDRYFKTLVAYIHQNPRKHGLVADYRDWRHSSYHTILGTQPTRLARDEVLGWFGDRADFVQYHEAIANFKGIADVIEDDA